MPNSALVQLDSKSNPPSIKEELTHTLPTKQNDVTTAFFWFITIIIAIIAIIELPLFKAIELGYKLLIVCGLFAISLFIGNKLWTAQETPKMQALSTAGEWLIAVFFLLVAIAPYLAANIAILAFLAIPWIHIVIPFAIGLIVAAFIGIHKYHQAQKDTARREQFEKEEVANIELTQKNNELTIEVGELKRTQTEQLNKIEKIGFDNAHFIQDTEIIYRRQLTEIQTQISIIATQLSEVSNCNKDLKLAQEYVPNQITERMHNDLEKLNHEIKSISKTLMNGIDQKNKEFQDLRKTTDTTTQSLQQVIQTLNLKIIELQTFIASKQEISEAFNETAQRNPSTPTTNAPGVSPYTNPEFRRSKPILRNRSYPSQVGQPLGPLLPDRSASDDTQLRDSSTPEQPLTVQPGSTGDKQSGDEQLFYNYFKRYPSAAAKSSAESQTSETDTSPPSVASNGINWS